MTPSSWKRTSASGELPTPAQEPAGLMGAIQPEDTQLPITEAGSEGSAIVGLANAVLIEAGAAAGIYILYETVGLKGVVTAAAIALGGLVAARQK